MLLPFRHFLYPGWMDWTEEGHQFAWRMKLRDKRGVLRFVAVDPARRTPPRYRRGHLSTPAATLSVNGADAGAARTRWRSR